MSTPAPTELEAPAEAISDDELFVRQTAQEEPEPTPIPHEPISHPSAPDETPSRVREDPEEIPNIVQKCLR
jgi:hypothetical protein